MYRVLIEKMARALVDDHDQVRVTEVWSDNTLILNLEVARGDVGRVLGKKGRNADAMRTILATAAAHSRKRVMLEIAD